MEIVDLDLLFQSPKKDATIIEGWERKQSQDGTMVGENKLKNPKKTLGKSPFYIPSNYDRWGKIELPRPNRPRPQLRSSGLDEPASSYDVSR